MRYLNNFSHSLVLRLRVNVVFLLTLLLPPLFIVGPWLLMPGYVLLTDFVWGPNSGSSLVQKLIIFLTLSLVCIGGAYLGRSLGLSKPLAYLVGLFALWNPFVYDRLMYGQINVLLAYGLLILVVTQRSYILLVICAGLAVLVLPHSIFLVLMLFAFLAIKQTLEAPNKFGEIVGHIVLTLFAILLIASPRIYSMVSERSEISSFLTTGITEADMHVFQTAGDSGVGKLVNVLMLSGFWGKDQFRYFDLTDFQENWGRSFLLLLPIILLGIYVAYRDVASRRLSILLMLVAASSVIFALGNSTAITAPIATFMFDNIPFYRGMREPQKWVALLCIVYAVFLSIGLKRLFKFEFVRAYTLSFSVFIGVVIVMQALPMAYGAMGQVDSSQYPSGWEEVDEYLLLDGCRGQTLVLPWHLYQNFKFTDRVISHPAKEYFSCQVNSGTNMEFGGIYDNSGSPLGRDVKKWLDTKGNFDLAKKQGITYILLLKEVDWQNYAWLDERSDVKVLLENDEARLYSLISSS